MGNQMSRTFSSEINSDPEEFRIRRYSDNEQPSAFEDDEADFPAGAMSTIASRRSKRESSLGLVHRPSTLSKRPSTDLQGSKSRKNKNISIDEFWTNSKDRRAGKSRSRLYSTASSMFRDNGQMMVLSPTRSASSFMAKAGNIRSQIRAWDLIHERNEGAVTDEEDDDDEQDEDADGVDSMTKVILDRLDSLDTMFKRMEDMLEKVVEKNH